VLLIGAIFEIGPNHVTPRARPMFTHEYFIFKRHDPTWSELKQRSAPFLEGQLLASGPIPDLNIDLISTHFYKTFEVF
jgi:hypothetical protein